MVDLNDRATTGAQFNGFTAEDAHPIKFDINGAMQPRRKKTPHRNLPLQGSKAAASVSCFDISHSIPHSAQLIPATKVRKQV